MRVISAPPSSAPLLLLPACSTNKAAPAPPPPPVVPVVEVTPESVDVSSEWITTLDGQVNAQVRPQVSGYLVKRNYQEGGRVRKGDVLFEIDSRPFAVALAQAEARLAEARAQLGRAEQDVARNTPLAKERAIAQSELDNNVQAKLAAEASVKAAQAAVDAARLNLEFTSVRSLVDGIAAIATAQIGDLVSPTTLLTTVSQVDPIRAYFSLSEREYLELAEAINTDGPARRLWAPARAATGARRRLRLSRGRSLPGRRPADRSEDRHDARQRVLPQSGRRAASRPVRTRHRQHPQDRGRPAGPAACGHRAAGRRAGARRLAGQHGADPAGGDGTARRQPLGRRTTGCRPATASSSTLVSWPRA